MNRSRKPVVVLTDLEQQMQTAFQDAVNHASRYEMVICLQASRQFQQLAFQLLQQRSSTSREISRDDLFSLYSEVVEKLDFDVDFSTLRLAYAVLFKCTAPKWCSDLKQDASTLADVCSIIFMIDENAETVAENQVNQPFFDKAMQSVLALKQREDEAKALQELVKYMHEAVRKYAAEKISLFGTLSEAKKQTLLEAHYLTSGLISEIEPLEQKENIYAYVELKYLLNVLEVVIDQYQHIGNLSNLSKKGNESNTFLYGESGLLFIRQQIIDCLNQTGPITPDQVDQFVQDINLKFANLRHNLFSNNEEVTLAKRVNQLLSDDLSLRRENKLDNAQEKEAEEIAHNLRGQMHLLNSFSNLRMALAVFRQGAVIRVANEGRKTASELLTVATESAEKFATTVFLSESIKGGAMSYETVERTALSLFKPSRLISDSQASDSHAQGVLTKAASAISNAAKACRNFFRGVAYILALPFFSQKKRVLQNSQRVVGLERVKIQRTC